MNAPIDSIPPTLTASAHHAAVLNIKKSKSTVIPNRLVAPPRLHDPSAPGTPGPPGPQAPAPPAPPALLALRPRRPQRPWPSAPEHPRALLALRPRRPQ